MVNAEVRENVFVCEYDIIHQRPTKDWGDNCLPKNLANILMQPVPSCGTVCLTWWQVLLIDLFQPYSLGWFPTVIWNQANMRRKGQFITVSMNYLQGVSGYSVNQTWCATLILAQFLKAAWVVFKRPMTLFSLSCVGFSYVPLYCFSTVNVPTVTVMWPEVLAIELFPFNYLWKSLPTPLKLFSSIHMWQHIFLPDRQLRRGISALWSTLNGTQTKYVSWHIKSYLD